MKRCSVCCQDFPIEHFWKSPTTGKRRSRCRACEAAKMRRYRAEHAEHERARDRARYATDESREARRQYKLRTKFGLSLAQYDDLLAAQGGACAICGRACCPTGRSLAVDHDHKTGAVRGVLCARCNNGLGNFQDDHARLLKAADYLIRAIPRTNKKEHNA